MLVPMVSMRFDIKWHDTLFHNGYEYIISKLESLIFSEKIAIMELGC